MAKGRKLQRKPSLGPLGHWLIRHEISITDFAEHANLAYRTVWLAAHGYKIDYATAEKVISSMETLQSGSYGVTIKTLCSGKPRADFVPTMG